MAVITETKAWMAATTATEINVFFMSVELLTVESNWAVKV
jgi:hypothetical protein